jgi:hypothetical protein
MAEEVTNAAPSTFQYYTLTPEVRAALSVPIPEQFIDTVDKGARGTFRVAMVDYLEKRLTEVDPGWEEELTTSGDGIIICTLTVLGVSRSGSAGIEPVSALPGEKGWKSYHMRVGAGQAAAERRACAKFGLGAELWPKHIEETEDGEYVPPAGATSRPSGGTWRSGSGKPQAQTAAPRTRTYNGRGPSEKQLELLTGDLQVPMDIATGLDNTDNSREVPSEASLVISHLISARRSDRNAYDRNPIKHIRDAKAEAEKVIAARRRNSRDEDYDED